jgi:hypothetical protein
LYSFESSPLRRKPTAKHNDPIMARIIESSITSDVSAAFVSRLKNPQENIGPDCEANDKAKSIEISRHE